MGRFNLIDDPWIGVIDTDGKALEVSLAEIFQNAQNYRRLAGDSRTQDFAVLRILLAILHTVLERYDLDGKLRDLKDQYWDHVDDETREDDLYKDWQALWNAKKLPVTVSQYLDEWYDRFYLFDDRYPFFQVTADEISEEHINKKRASSIAGRNINRMISESANKVALFAPKYDAQKNKDILTASEIARWLIAIQGYIGLSDKVIFGKDKYKASKGWLFDIGGLYFEGDNVLETLLINCVLVHPRTEYRFNSPKPCWEQSPAEIIEGYFNDFQPDNLAELYTIWSRAIYIDPDFDPSQPFECQVVKLPDLEHQNQFLEPMTIWRYNKSGENKNKYTPRKHQANQAVWRSFGLIVEPDSEDNKQIQPGIVQWLNQLHHIFDPKLLAMNAVSMRDDGNATSWVPVDETCDTIHLQGFAMIDLNESNWVPRINDTIQVTKEVAERTFRNFLNEIAEIRNYRDKSFVDRNIRELYFNIDTPFRQWLLSIDINDSKNKKIQEWYEQLYEIVNNQVSLILKAAGSRDFIGIIDKKDSQSKGEKVKNIATAHNSLSYFLWIKLKEE